MMSFIKDMLAVLIVFAAIGCCVVAFEIGQRKQESAQHG